jgi:hypothetical protein
MVVLGVLVPDPLIVLSCVTLSKPTSVNRAFAIGLRYVKKNMEIQTEDHFAVEPGSPIERHYRGSLEQKWPEYGGTH